jgi:ATP/maltotriose-dependent transcriptional regulator MalT
MESMSRANWTDERLEDFARNTDRRFDEVDRRFDRVEADLRELRSDMNARFEAQQQHMDARFEAQQGHMDARFDIIDTRLHALQRTMIQTTIGMSAIVVTALVALAG